MVLIIFTRAYLTLCCRCSYARSRSTSSAFLPPTVCARPCPSVSL